MGVTDKDGIIKVDYESGDQYGDEYDNGWNRQRVYDAIDDESIMEKIPDTDIYILHNRALHIGTENPDTYFFDDDGGALIWRGSVDSKYLFDNEGYCKIDGITAICEISGKYWSTYNAEEMKASNIKLGGFIRVSSRDSDYENYEFFGIHIIALRGGNTIKNAIHKGDSNGYRSYGYWIRGTEDIENLQIINYNYGLWFDLVYFSGEATIENIQLIDCDNDIRYRLNDKTGTLNIINSRLDPTSESIGGSYEGAIATLNLQNRFQIYIENGSNASATLKDKDGNEIISGTLDSEGKWLLDDLVTWVQRYLETADGELVKNELNYKEPFILEVKKNGLQDLIIPGIRCSIYDSKKDKRIGSWEDTVVEGRMVGKNYVDRTISGEIDTIELSGEVEIIELSGEVS